MALFVSGKLFNKANVGEGGGGDQHNLGWYATESALTTAHPTATDGDWAIVGATDTVWVWDTDTSSWKDGDTKGQVTSVNNQTGAVTITEADILPSQTGNAGKFLVTDGTDASWGNALQNTATGTNSLTLLGNATASAYAVNIGKNSTGDASCVAVGYSAEAKHLDGCVAIGKNSLANGGRSIAIGTESRADGEGTIAIGRGRVQSANTIQLNATNGAGLSELNEQYTMHVVLRQGVRLKLIDTDGTIPTDRFTTTPSADGTYVPTLTISSGVATRSWSAPSGGGSTGTTASLVVANWSSNTQTVNVTGVTASNNVIVAPAPASQADYTAAGIICTAQGAGTLTFTCTTVPSSAITVNVLII